MRSNLLLTIFSVFILGSCGLKPISSEHTLLYRDKKDITLSDLGNGKILIYNDANILHTSDNTSRLNIMLDNRNLGQLRAKDYAVVELEKGTHHFNLRHLDVVNMKSDHEVNVSDSIKIIRVKPTITSNKLEIVNKLPGNWEKYHYMDSK